MRMKIPFSEIPEHGLQIKITETSWLPEELLADHGPVAAEMVLTRKGDNSIEVQGNLRAQIRLNCDRCLAMYRYTLSTPVQLLVEAPDTDHWHVHDLEHHSGDLEILQVEEPVVDIADILRQQVLLVLPVKKLCREDCPGICPHCGANRNDRQCGCADGLVNSPFQVLAKLKKNDKS